MNLEFERQIGAPPEVVYSYFTDSEKYTKWMGVAASLDPRPGGVFRVTNANGAVSRGEYLELEPHSRIAFSWGFENDPEIPPGSSRVTVTLEPVDGGTALRLVHSGLPSPDWEASHEEGWTTFLDQLVTVTRSSITPERS